MRMVKSLLLGGAAALVASAGAQAADLPMKAKAAVQYVKVCSLYGAGFYYVPGTDTCLKVGGWVRGEYAYDFGNSMTTGPFAAGGNTRIANGDYNIRTRGYITADARTQSAYGTIRSYIAVGVNYDSGPAGGAAAFSSNRAFIQFAGFTFGTAQSFYDFYSAAAAAYLASIPSSDTGDPGGKVAAYTAQFGNGFSATISLEEPRRSGVVNATGLAVPLGALPASNEKGNDYPDVVANLRVDQPWGAAQVMGALHESSGGYYAGGVNSGHPSDTWGYALGAGVRIKFPSIGPGDYLDTQFNYTKGAIRYAAFTPGGAYDPYFYSGNTVGYGVFTDGVFTGTAVPGTQTSTDLTTAWNFNAHYEHYWTPALHSSLYGGYLQVNYGAQANKALCAVENGTLFAVTAAQLLNCNNDFGWWWIGSRTQWDITKQLYVGLDVIYLNLITATPGVGTAPFAGFGGQPVAVRNISDQGTWSFRARVHRDFNP